MRLLAMIAPLSVIAVIAFAANDSKPPSFPSLIAFEHHDSARTQLVAQANFEGSVVRDPGSLQDEDGKATVPQRLPMASPRTFLVSAPRAASHLPDHSHVFVSPQLLSRLQAPP
jgi:hypothetical protein